ncbi:MAG: xanthine dehydrogenase family protein subunit M [Hyphomicrobiaceae bacterium]
MQAFSYERPETVDAAVQMLEGDQARPLAGGTDLIPQLREGRREVRVVVDLKHIAAARGIGRWTDGGWRIGATVSVRELGGDPGLAQEHPALIAAARLIGSVQIQSRATLGGNLCNGAPSADAVPLLMSLEANAQIAGQGGQRIVPVESLCIGPGKTSLAPGELLVALLLPPRPERSAARYLRFTPRREMDIAIAGSGVAVTLDQSGAVAAARITLASVAPVPLRAGKAETRLIGERPTAALLAEAAQIAAKEARPISDTRASADYRRELVAVLTRRALEACVAEAGRGGAAP